MEKMEEFINWLKENGWKINIKSNNVEYLLKNIMEKYKIPKEYKTFLENIQMCTNAEENIWFLCIEDYQPKSEDDFRWNEFELISLEAAEGDEELINDIKNFWDTHLPIMLNVKGDYEYYAINVRNKKIIHGIEPEFEESSKIVANNFIDFLDKIMKNEIEL